MEGERDEGTVFGDKFVSTAGIYGHGVPIQCANVGDNSPKPGGCPTAVWDIRLSPDLTWVNILF